MSNRLLYFAYGSNMAVERLGARVSSAQLVGIAELTGHVLKFHKPGKVDGSGKCDAAYSGRTDDRVYGALYSILESELPVLDKYEGQGDGYERKAVVVHSRSSGKTEAQTYVATRFDSLLRPLDWYKEHVVRGARAINLPQAYILSIEAVECHVDPDAERRAGELAIYGWQFR